MFVCSDPIIALEKGGRMPYSSVPTKGKGLGEREGEGRSKFVDIVICIDVIVRLKKIFFAVRWR